MTEKEALKEFNKNKKNLEKALSSLISKGDVYEQEFLIDFIVELLKGLADYYKLGYDCSSKHTPDKQLARVEQLLELYYNIEREEKRAEDEFRKRLIMPDYKQHAIAKFFLCLGKFFTE